MNGWVNRGNKKNCMMYVFKVPNLANCVSNIDLYLCKEDLFLIPQTKITAVLTEVTWVNKVKVCIFNEATIYTSHT